jgi:hypothetical protein
MPIGAIIGAGMGLLGSSMQADAAQSAAQSNVEAARIAAEAQKFRPVGVTTRFGTSNFQMGIPGVSAPSRSAYQTQAEYDQALSDYQTRVAKEGQLVSAGYNVAPDIAAMRDRLFSQAGGQGFQTAEQAQTAQQGLFNLGNQYLAQSPEAAAQQWMTSQQALLAPSREQSLAQLRTGLFNSGREGLSIAQGGNLQATNPELAAFANAQAMQDLQLASQAQQQGRAQTQFGAGLFGTGLDIATAGYNPLKTQFGLGQTMESAGQGALDLGLNIGGRTTQGAANAANTIYNAQTAANAANAYSPVGASLMGAAGNQQLLKAFTNMANPFGGTPQGAYGQQEQYLAGALSNPQTQQARMLAAQWGE